MALGVLMCVGAVARAETVQVELVEDEVAQVVLLDTGKAEVVPRGTLPAGAREGDVLVDGKRDAKATAKARRAVRQARSRAFPER